VDVSELIPCPECGTNLGGSRSIASHPGWGREGDLERLIKSHVESYCGAETSQEIRKGLLEKYGVTIAELREGTRDD
jgi:hypothetical protein